MVFKEVREEGCRSLGGVALPQADFCFGHLQSLSPRAPFYSVQTPSFEDNVHSFHRSLSTIFFSLLALVKSSNV